ncbi:hypothetical protein FNF29_00231 [Cafeteria roenbergensis]|uniref:Uncharacterized protein n=1 Tax=Cafeteria roenbergensis TaxID=33653 RepID=A0A5A8CXL3_CAFRO|nr:hypothetical protein FNF29_00231 [Cafeteria roenbergensis]|eukprot:KAA0157655.1 hypothetical protein FNF29_00231 [Cafeteria roenbergensis]
MCGFGSTIAEFGVFDAEQQVAVTLRNPLKATTWALDVLLISAEALSACAITSRCFEPEDCPPVMLARASHALVPSSVTSEPWLVHALATIVAQAAERIGILDPSLVLSGPRPDLRALHAADPALVLEGADTHAEQFTAASGGGGDQRSALQYGANAVPASPGARTHRSSLTSVSGSFASAADMTERDDLRVGALATLKARPGTSLLGSEGWTEADDASSSVNSTDTGAQQLTSSWEASSCDEGSPGHAPGGPLDLTDRRSRRKLFGILAGPSSIFSDDEDDGDDGDVVSNDDPVLSLAGSRPGDAAVLRPAASTARDGTAAEVVRGAAARRSASSEDSGIEDVTADVSRLSSLSPDSDDDAMLVEMGPGPLPEAPMGPLEPLVEGPSDNSSYSSDLRHGGHSRPR